MLLLFILICLPTITYSVLSWQYNMTSTFLLEELLSQIDRLSSDSGRYECS